MKKPRNVKSFVKPTLEIPPAFTKLEELADGNIHLTHSQGVKQVIGFQSMDCSYGLSVDVKPANVHRARKVLATAVQEMLAPKVKEQSEFLQRLAAANR